MSTAVFRFHGRLNYFLRHDQRDNPIAIEFRGQQSIKHLAESLGVPHPEIGRVQVNGLEGGVDTITQDGNQIELYPMEDGCPIQPRFLLDCHLGRLAAYLRMLGFDCLYEEDFEDQAMTDIVIQEERILLTRDRRLLMRKVIEHGYCLRSLDSFGQLKEVVERYELDDLIQPFHRCIRCNHLLEPVDKEAVIDRLRPLTKKYFDEFHICPACGQIYWKGSHFDRMQELIEKLQKMVGKQ